ncbi:hypothetical protein HAX54_036476, partial [Datura stramonium]|nr:hypothetical protein [Datura stramonium]
MRLNVPTRARVAALCTLSCLCVVPVHVALVPAPHARPCVGWSERCPMRMFNCFAPRFQR